MGMNSNQVSDQEDVMLEMNMTPLIDVMLVLIIMFIITIPLQNDAISIDMPTPSNEVVEKPPELIKIKIQADGQIFWNELKLNNKTELEQHLQRIPQQATQDQIQIMPERKTAYKDVAMVMALAQRLGVKNMGIINFQS